MPQKRKYLIVGLGNPGRVYVKTRHNIGFMVADKIAAEFSIQLEKKKFNTLFGNGLINNKEVIIAKPMAFMNQSGPPVRNLADFFNILCEDMLVIHDDIDLAYNRLKIKSKGGHGGHNGIRSLINAFGSADFARLRVGIGRPEAQDDVVDHVLGKFSAEEKEILGQTIERARDAAVTIICNGVNEAMNGFN